VIGWPLRDLGDVLTLQRGFDLPAASRRKGYVPVVSSSGITGFHDEARASAPGVVIGRYGTLGKVYFVDVDYWPLNTALFVKDFKGNDPRFCGYLLETVAGVSNSAAAAIPGVNRNVLHKIRLRCPDVRVQRRIASILGAYDDLIEVNRRRIAVLKEMSLRLFDEWFVQFRFPGHELQSTKPHVDGLPAGWQWRTIGDLASHISRGISPRYDEAGPTIVISQKCIRDQRLSLAPSRRQTRPIPDEKRVRHGDILINSTGVGTLGRVAQADSVPANVTVDSHVTIVRPRSDVDKDFLGHALRRMEAAFERLSTGATGQTELSRTSIAESRLIVPPAQLQASFGRHARPVRELCDRLARQNVALTSCRDLLLPRLVSGELSIGTAERELEGAAA
jgi:type I restriction enzyme S subunit